MLNIIVILNSNIKVSNHICTFLKKYFNVFVVFKQGSIDESLICVKKTNFLPFINTFEELEKKLFGLTNIIFNILEDSVNKDKNINVTLSNYLHIKCNVTQGLSLNIECKNKLYKFDINVKDYSCSNLELFNSLLRSIYENYTTHFAYKINSSDKMFLFKSSNNENVQVPLENVQVPVDAITGKVPGTQDNRDKKFTYIYPTCNWQSSKQLYDDWKKFSKTLEGEWDNIKLTPNKSEADYYLVVNQTSEQLDPSKIIYMCMEPNAEKVNFTNYIKYIKHVNPFFSGLHDYQVNNTEWHLSPSFDTMKTIDIKKKYDNVLSVVVSDKNYDPGHIARLNFIRELDERCYNKTLPFEIHIYGSPNLNLKNYKGGLPRNSKDDGLFPYKYHFNAENNAIDNYITEKFTDSILSECFMFYWGCPNISFYHDTKCYKVLSLKKEDLEKDINTIYECMKEDSYSKNLNNIKEAKQKILKTYNLFPRLKTIVKMGDIKLYLKMNVAQQNINEDESVKQIINNLKKQSFRNFNVVNFQRNTIQTFFSMINNCSQIDSDFIMLLDPTVNDIEYLYRDLNIQLTYHREQKGVELDIVYLSKSERINYLDTSFYMSGKCCKEMMNKIKLNTQHYYMNVIELFKDLKIESLRF
jgi:hypothetical protein